MRTATRALAGLLLAVALASCQWFMPISPDGAPDGTVSPGVTHTSPPAVESAGAPGPSALPVQPSEAPRASPSIEIPPPID